MHALGASDQEGKVQQVELSHASNRSAPDADGFTSWFEGWNTERDDYGGGIEPGSATCNHMHAWTHNTDISALLKEMSFDTWWCKSYTINLNTKSLQF